jgi:hypothetical protein
MMRFQEARAAAPLTGGRSESDLERYDRNLVELLQEIRVVQSVRRRAVTF